MYLRFVTARRDPGSGEPGGVFQAMYALEDAGALDPFEAARWKALDAWFTRHLPRPPRMARSTRPGAHAQAVSWFRASAREHIARMHEIAAILAEHGIVVRMIQTDRPGYVVYEDEHQVAAEPFRGDAR